MTKGGPLILVGMVSQSVNFLTSLRCSRYFDLLEAVLRVTLSLPCLIMEMGLGGPLTGKESVWLDLKLRGGTWWVASELLNYSIILT